MWGANEMNDIEKGKRLLFLDIINYVNDKRINNECVSIDEVISYISDKENIKYVLMSEK